MEINASVMFIIVTCIFLSRMSVECTNTSESLKSSPDLKTVKWASIGHVNSKKYTLPPGNKTRLGNKKFNDTVEKLKLTKPNLRIGPKVTKSSWPKTQKADLRQNLNSGTSTRYTHMNMMQMDNEISTAPSVNHDNYILPEFLSPYTIKEDMTQIAANFTNANVTVEVIGRTLEYNDIVLMKISQLNDVNARFRADDKKYVDDTAEKKIIFIVHGLSAMGIHKLRCLSKTAQFVDFVSHYLEHLDLFDIFLIPLANPDGYGYKKSQWNKNLSPQDACPGVALDRNFDIAWNTTRVTSSCSQQYPGPAPFSEPETRAIRDTLHRYTHKIIAYIHVHSGSPTTNVYKGDAVLYPKGYTDVQTDDDKYIDLKGEIDEAMRKASFQVYSVTLDTLYNWYGKVSGSSVDYASAVYGIPYAMEFVMQLYLEDKIGSVVVSEVWKRVIDVAMKSIWNSFHSIEI